MTTLSLNVNTIHSFSVESMMIAHAEHLHPGRDPGFRGRCYRVPVSPIRLKGLLLGVLLAWVLCPSAVRHHGQSSAGLGLAGREG